VAYGPFNSSNSTRRRRRADVTVGGYSVHDGRIFFSNRCPKTSDKNATQYSSSVTTCVKQRLAYCNSLVNDATTTTSFIEWKPVPTFAFSIYSSYLASYQTLSPSNIYGVPQSKASAIGNSLNLNSYTLTELSKWMFIYFLVYLKTDFSFVMFITDYGCRYVGPLPLSTINSLIAAQSSVTTTTAATTNAAG
jgi:hypothetical protein